MININDKVILTIYLKINQANIKWFSWLGQYTGILDAIKWATDYFIKCHVNPNELYGQIGDFEIDHAYWGRPEDMNMTRPAYKIDQTHPGLFINNIKKIIYWGVKKNYTSIIILI